MLAEVILPELGADPAQPILVSFWFADEDEEVFEGDRLVEITLSGVTFDVAAPASGRLVEILAVEDDPVQVGDVLGLIESPEELGEQP